MFLDCTGVWGLCEGKRLGGQEGTVEWEHIVMQLHCGVLRTAWTKCFLVSSSDVKRNYVIVGSQMFATWQHCTGYLQAAGTVRWVRMSAAACWLWEMPLNCRPPLSCGCGVLPLRLKDLQESSKVADISQALEADQEAAKSACSDHSRYWSTDQAMCDTDLTQ